MKHVARRRGPQRLEPKRTFRLLAPMLSAQQKSGMEENEEIGDDGLRQASAGLESLYRRPDHEHRVANEENGLVERERTRPPVQQLFRAIDRPVHRFNQHHSLIPQTHLAMINSVVHAMTHMVVMRARLDSRSDRHESFSSHPGRMDLMGVPLLCCMPTVLGSSASESSDHSANELCFRVHRRTLASCRRTGLSREYRIRYSRYRAVKARVTMTGAAFS